MNYIIDAHLERGRPQLRIVDAQTGAVRWRWSDGGYLVPREEEPAEEGCTCGGRDSLHRLFKMLVLLSCAERIGLAERARSPTFGEECLECTACVDHSVDHGESPLPMYAAPTQSNVIPLRDTKRTRRGPAQRRDV